ncbi:MAG: pilus assembly protein PilM, partial [Candidatus Pacebacteria bacterium]|nr:pilus assembly protein PilM [Candidatus Paceibacterota bacterium]
KIVEIRKKGGRVILETYGSIALAPYAGLDAGQITNLPVEQIAVALKEVLKQSGASSSEPAFAIPVQQSLIFVIDLPAQIKESEISSIVPTEARKYIPLPIAEVSLDYFVFPKKELSFEEMNTTKTEDTNTTISQIPKEKTEVLVVATQNDAISKYRSIISLSNLSASFLEIEIFSSVRSNFEHELSPVLLMDFGASRTKLSIVEFGMLKSFHSIERGGTDISLSISQSLGIPFAEAEKIKKEYGFLDNSEEKNLVDIIKVHTNYIFSEANNVLLDYEKKYNRVISKVIFTGGGALLKGLPEIALNNFRAEIIIGHPFNKVGAPSFLSKVLESIGPEFAVSLGLALRKLQ